MEIQSKAANVGLNVNLHKSSILWWTPKGFEAPAAEQQALEAFTDMQVPISREGADVLGGFTGIDSYVRRGIRSRFNGIQQKHEQIRGIVTRCKVMTQRFFRYLQLFVNPLPAFPLRITPLKFTVDVTEGHDLSLARLLMEIATDPQLHHPTTAIFVQELTETALSTRPNLVELQ